MDKCCEKWAHTATFWARLPLGLFFLIAGWGKVADAAMWTEMLTNMNNVLPEGLVGVYGAVLPWAEIVAGLALVVGFRARWAAWLIALMLLSFWINAAASPEMVWGLETLKDTHLIMLGVAVSLGLTGSKVWTVDSMMKK